ncbi:MAG: hypothetical protein F6K51_32675, partial [Moorea sp. SIO3I8]|nr:hypothetical protein [Moorena sp. SIO3I8]
ALYQDSLKVYRDMYNVTQTLIDETLEQGIEQGIKQGIKQGRAEGRAEGKAEGRQEEKQQIAKQMKAAGLPAQDIAQYTGLSMDEIDRL